MTGLIHKLSAFFLIAVVLTGCSGSVQTSSLLHIGQFSNSAADTIRVAVIPPAFTSPFHVSVKDGAMQKAKQLGWNIDVVAADRETDFAGQVSIAEQELQKGISAIAINPIDSKAIVSAVKEANREGIPDFMQNLITPVEGGNVV